MAQNFLMDPNGGPVQVTRMGGGVSWVNIVVIALAAATLVVACYNLYLTVKHRKVHEKLDERLNRQEENDI